jgi:excisionase family DNA binding protein
MEGVNWQAASEPKKPRPRKSGALEVVSSPLGPPLLTLKQAADHLQWSRRTLIRRLKQFGIPTIGTGRLARIELADLETLKRKEREEARKLQPSPVGAGQLTRKPSKSKPPMLPNVGSPNAGT